MARQAHGDGQTSSMGAVATAYRRRQAPAVDYGPLGSVNSRAELHALAFDFPRALRKSTDCNRGGYP